MFGHDATRSSFALALVLLDALLAICYVERLVGSARGTQRSSATMHNRTGTETAPGSNRRTKMSSSLNVELKETNNSSWKPKATPNVRFQSWDRK